MLYRLRAPRILEWCDVPRLALEAAAKHDADLDELPWQPTERRVASDDMIRLALRYGFATNQGIALDAAQASSLGWADEIRRSQQGYDESQAKIRASATGQLMERIMPGWATAGDELDAEVRNSVEAAAQRADAQLAEDLAAPAESALEQHWSALHGHLPD